MSDIDALAELVAGLEARLVRLEKRGGFKVPAPTPPWVPHKGSAVSIVLRAVVGRGGIWSPDRAMDAMCAAGWDSDAENPTSAAQYALKKLLNEGYVNHISRGRYRYTGKALPVQMLEGTTS